MWNVGDLFIIMVVLHELACQNSIIFENGTEDDCPKQCNCFLINDRTDCSGQNLSFLPTPISPEVQTLDLSYNSFETIPDGLQKLNILTSLYMHHNKISSLDELTLNISTLQLLDLSHNEIISWRNVHPNRVLRFARSLRELRLSHNKIRFINEDLVLNSTTLEHLKLENCSLKNISRNFLQGVVNLKHLQLANNSLRHIPTFSSGNLTSLNLSRNYIDELPINILNKFPSLKLLTLSYNHMRHFSLVESKSLELLDLSFCNLERANLNRLVNLKQALIKGNHIGVITENSFSSKKLEHLDLSMNSIRRIEKDSFKDMIALITLDLSMNLINHLDEYIFSNNLNLKIVTLSRNYLTTINFFNPSLKYLDMSNCEIQFINEDFLKKFPSLLRLELSRNLIGNLPKIKITTLEYLDLSLNKISDIANETFIHLENLKTLNLQGNRLTTGLKFSYFPKYLKNIILDDNLWICNCFSIDLREFYDYLTKPPAKITDSYKLICHSPENITGQPWHLACSYVWFGNGLVRHKEKVWLYVILAILAMTVIFCSVLSIKKMRAIKRIREQRERERLQAEARERLRVIRIQQRQAAQQNAPDPRELVRPPSYAEAVLLPRIDASNASLAGSRANINGSRSNMTGSRGNLSGSRSNVTGSSNDVSRRRAKQSTSGAKKTKKTKPNVSESNTEVEADIETQEPDVRTENTDDSEEDSAAVNIIPKHPVIESNL